VGDSFEDHPCCDESAHYSIVSAAELGLPGVTAVPIGHNSKEVTSEWMAWWWEMSDKTCQGCGGETNTAVCDYLLYEDQQPRRCYAKWEGGRWLPGCGLAALSPDSPTRKFVERIIAEGIGK
jgi:hypothetical protein